MKQSAAAWAPIVPDAWLGVVGGGQLGRMFCQAAQRLGYKVAVLDPDPHSPAGQIAQQHFCAAYDDEQALQQMGQLCQAITTEFENVPAQTLAKLSTQTRVAPSAAAVALTQDRRTEKQFIQQAGVEVAPFCAVVDKHDIAQAADALFPGILKTAQMGYDGKGQVRVANKQEAEQAFVDLNEVPCVLEAQLPLVAELSVVLVRSAQGEIQCFDPAYNEHRGGILALSQVEQTQSEVAQRAQALACQIAQQADYVGVLCVEFFLLEGQQLVANEIAPRPHNSGHHSIEACLSSQFEQQVRALAGLPLGSTELIQAAVMVNILGDCWAQGTPDWAAVLAVDGVALHLYGKAEARPGRKMGHLTALGSNLAQAQARAAQAAQVLGIAISASV